MARIFPSLISADLLNLQKEIAILEPHCDGFHLDSMDNHFVPNLTMGPAIINAIGSITTKPLWIHLMVTDPITIIDALTVPAGSIITIHYESAGNKKKLIEHIQHKEWQPSLAISPETPIEHLFPYMDTISQVLIMSVNPGFSGQPMITDTIKKIEPLVAYKNANRLHCTIAMDGGINSTNITQLYQKGVEDFALASALFKTSSPIETLTTLKKLLI